MSSQTSRHEPQTVDLSVLRQATSQHGSVTDRRPVRERWKDGEMKRGEMAVDEKGRER